MKKTILPEIRVLKITEKDLQRAEAHIAEYKKKERQEGFYDDYDKSVDETLLRIIEQDGLSDDDFFEYIGESPRYLQYEPFQKKILRWQEILYSEYYTESDKYKAKDNLKKIGNCLSYEGSGRKKNSRQEKVIFYEYMQLMEILSPIVDRMWKTRSPAARNLLFKENFPDYYQFVAPINGKKTANELARKILAKAYNKNSRTIDSILAENMRTWKRTVPYRKS